MSNKTENTDLDGRSQLKYIALLSVYGLLNIFTIGFIFGYLNLHFSDNHESLSLIDLLTLSIAFLAILIFGYATYHTHKARKKVTEALTPKERLNRNILLFSTFLAVIMSLIFFWQNIEENAIFSNAPIPTFTAILLAIIWAIVLPVIYIYWYKKATDEQEIYAYQKGAYYASHFYLIAAPLWWILWRGGLVPEPNGIAIFIIFNCIWSGIWLWKKYRG